MLFLKEESGTGSKARDVFERLRTAVTSPDAKYIAKRLLYAALTVFAVITVTFFIMNAVPGGPFQAEKNLPDEVIAELEAKYGLDKPLIVQYFNYLRGIFLDFDFGPSIKKEGRAVMDIIADGMRTSVPLGAGAALIAAALGIALGAFAAILRGRAPDRLIMVATTAFVSMPSFIMGTLLLLFLAIQLGIFPANGAAPGGLVLPVITLSLYPMAYITRLTRSSMLDVLEQDYVRVARAKGVPKFRIIFVHALRNALIPVITYFGPMLANIVTGSLVVEKIFAVPGIGRAFVGSITGRDYPLIMGTTIVLSVLIVLMNLISDILYKLCDPRIKLE